MAGLFSGGFVVVGGPRFDCLVGGEGGAWWLGLCGPWVQPCWLGRPLSVVFGGEDPVFEFGGKAECRPATWDHAGVCRFGSRTNLDIWARCVANIPAHDGSAWAWAFCPRRDLLGAVLFGRSGTADDWVRVAFGEPISLAGGAWVRFGRSAGLDRGVVAQV